MVISLEEIKLYLRVDSDEEDTLITSFIYSAQEMCEGILRYPIDTFTEIPNTVKQAVCFAVANMYEEREKMNITHIQEVMKALLFFHRNESW